MHVVLVDNRVPAYLRKEGYRHSLRITETLDTVHGVKNKGDDDSTFDLLCYLLLKFLLNRRVSPRLKASEFAVLVAFLTCRPLISLSASFMSSSSVIPSFIAHVIITGELRPLGLSKSALFQLPEGDT
jgi:hypothetical protein